MMSSEELTLNFKITNKEKFQEFHKKVFCYKKEHTDKLSEEIGGYAVISSWSNPFEENERLEMALDYALERLEYEETDICRLISEGKTQEQAEYIVKEESNE